MKLNGEMKAKLSELEKEEVRVLVKGAVSAFYEKYDDEAVVNYLNQIEESILENLQFSRG
jgi:hypothetical protein